MAAQAFLVANSKVASVPHVFPTRNFEWLVINTLPISPPYFCYSQQLENLPGSA